MKNPLKVSFIIPNWNHKDLLYECISSIYHTVGDISHEIVVVDNASTDGSGDYTRSFPELIWIQNEANLGYAKAVNQGVERSAGEFLFLLNNDIVLKDDTTQLLISFLREHSDAGAVAPLLYYPDGRLQISCRRFPNPLAIILEKLRVNKIGRFGKLKLTPEEHLAGGRVFQPMTSALMVKRQCWNEVGPMDERFPLFFNDVDWCYRLYKNTQYMIYLYPVAGAVHHEGASVNRLGYRKKIELYKGFLRFCLKRLSL